MLWVKYYHPVNRKLPCILLSQECVQNLAVFHSPTEASTMDHTTQVLRWPTTAFKEVVVKPSHVRMMGTGPQAQPVEKLCSHLVRTQWGTLCCLSLVVLHWMIDQIISLPSSLILWGRSLLKPKYFPTCKHRVFWFNRVTHWDTYIKTINTQPNQNTKSNQPDTFAWPGKPWTGRWGFMWDPCSFVGSFDDCLPLIPQKCVDTHFTWSRISVITPAQTVKRWTFVH